MPVSQEIRSIEIALTRERVRPHRPASLEREPNARGAGAVRCALERALRLQALQAAAPPASPPTAEAVRVQAGEENAGVVDIGDGLAVVFKIESHNHPSASRALPGRGHRRRRHRPRHPRHGRAPHRAAQLAALRRAPTIRATATCSRASLPASPATATASACPTWAARYASRPTYSGNPLVNAMCVGLLDADGALDARRRRRQPRQRAHARRRSATGRDGIHGASGLASRTFEEEREMRPTVQVGDPFLEKCSSRPVWSSPPAATRGDAGPRRGGPHQLHRGVRRAKAGRASS